MSKKRTVIKVLLSGEELNLKQIAEKVSDAEGKENGVQDVSNLMSRLSDSNKCDLGFFIRRNKARGRFAYKMLSEALKLTEKQAYELTLKQGKNRYTLENAVNDFPGLNKLVNRDDIEKSDRTIARKNKPAKQKKSPVSSKNPGSIVAETDFEKMAVGFIRMIADLPDRNEIAGLNEKLDRIEKMITGKKKTAKNDSPEKTKVKKTATAAETVLNAINKFKSGIGMKKLREKTGFEVPKLRNTIRYLKRKKKIRTKKRGIYIPA